MSFADILSKKAAETEAERESAKPPVQETVVTKDTNAFASLLGAKAAEHKTIEQPKADTMVVKESGAFKALLSQRQQELRDSRDPTKIQTEFETGDVGKWSFSTLKNFEQCAYLVYQAKIERKPQKQSDAASRGDKLHQAAEDFVEGRTDKLDPILAKHFERDITSLRELYLLGKVTVEEEWGIRKDWSPCHWDDPELWGRAKLDVFVNEGDSCRIIDYKSGRKFGNELKHSDQGLSYALHVYHRFPEIEIIEVEFWYIDQNDKLRRVYTRKQLGILLARYHARAMAMTTETEWTPKPSKHNCDFCPYGNGRFGNGLCPHAE